MGGWLRNAIVGFSLASLISGAQADEKKIGWGFNDVSSFCNYGPVGQPPCSLTEDTYTGLKNTGKVVCSNNPDTADVMYCNGSLSPIGEVMKAYITHPRRHAVGR